MLRTNLALNFLSAKVTVHAAAAGTRSSKAFLTDQGLSSRITEQDKPRSHPIAILDFYSVAGSTPIDVLKIDIEGSEYELLADARFLSLPVVSLVMEWHPTDRYPGHSGAEWCRQRLHAAGYSVQERRGFNVMWGLRK
jgi:FkbM family methyltransferase